MIKYFSKNSGFKQTKKNPKTLLYTLVNRKYLENVNKNI